MLRKYNIALIPQKIENSIINIAQKFSDISDKYQLGKQSFPHITLCQFQSEEKNIKLIWDQACDALPQNTIKLEFKEISCLTFDNVVHWVSLMPNERLLLTSMHKTVSSIVGIPFNQFYDPHMTLINTKYQGYKNKAEEIFKSYTPISDFFILSIGDCDTIGQLTKLIYQINMI